MKLRITFEASSSTQLPYETFFYTANLARPSGSSGMPGIITRPPHINNGVLGIFILSLALTLIVLFLAICYVLLRICNRSNETGKCDRNNRPEDVTTPRIVPHPKRIYELQAEEGCYSRPPSLNGKPFGMSGLNSSASAPDEKAIRCGPKGCPASVNSRHVETGSLNRVKLPKSLPSSACNNKETCEDSTTAIITDRRRLSKS
uniref:Uncharacterized protein n=1 Tax=Ascaris lumbricoides TaxID=6252 RepID=A0A0M3HTY4_ASCLU